MASSFQLFDAREIIDFPAGDPDNDTETIISGYRFNVSTLEEFGYQLYDNQTISNGSKCYLTFEPYNPIFLFTNGTFQNTTSCYSATEPIGTRGHVAIGVAAAFGIGLCLSITALAKHGRRYLPAERRFYPIGRRWQYYWACFTCAFALISLFTQIDIDRYYIQELPIILHCATWFIMCQGTIAMVWEAIRHWGSWQERQFVDPNHFVYNLNDRRAKIEFWLPMWCYLWIWMNFFMTIPRSWNFTKLQRSPQQIEDIFIPNATSIRFTIGGVCLAVAWVAMCFSLRHSIRHYMPHHRGVFNRVRGCVAAIPIRFILILTLAAVLIAYQIFISFKWEWSLMRLGGNVPVIFGVGYGPSLLIVYIQVINAYFSPNEDKELIRQRVERGVELDRELGITKKPAWWKRRKDEETLHQTIIRNVNEVGGGRGIGRRAEGDFERHIRENALNAAVSDIELDNINSPRVDRAGAKATSSPSPSQNPGWSPLTLSPASDSPFGVDYIGRGRLASSPGTAPPPYADGGPGQHRSNSQSTTHSTQAPPQQVRSMLDV